MPTPPTPTTMNSMNSETQTFHNPTVGFCVKSILTMAEPWTWYYTYNQGPYPISKDMLNSALCCCLTIVGVHDSLCLCFLLHKRELKSPCLSVKTNALSMNINRHSPHKHTRTFIHGMKKISIMFVLETFGTKLSWSWIIYVLLVL